MDLSHFDYSLPQELIAQFPSPQRDESRLLVINRRNETCSETHFKNLTAFLSPNDLLILNDTYVLPARLLGKKADSGAAIEMLLLEPQSEKEWEVLAYRASRLRPGIRVIFSDLLHCEVIRDYGEGKFQVRFSWEGSWDEVLRTHGHISLPPYIGRENGRWENLDRDRYQTIYARKQTTYNSAAAPTAGLHFTPELLYQISQLDIDIGWVTLRVGLDTFLPMRVDQVEKHPIHSEAYHVPQETADLMVRARSQGKRIIAVGTTTVRVLESAITANGEVQAGPGRTELFIYPGYRFKMVDALITNFHLPRTTLLLLVSAFMGNELRRRAYDLAVQKRFRFYSYGDAMLIL